MKALKEFFSEPVFGFTGDAMPSFMYAHSKQKLGNAFVAFLTIQYHMLSSNNNNGTINNGSIFHPLSNIISLQMLMHIRSRTYTEWHANQQIRNK